MSANFSASSTTMYMHPDFSTKHSKPGAKNQILIKHTQTLSHLWPNNKNIDSIINQHPEHQVSKTLWLIVLYTTKCNNSLTELDPSTKLQLNMNQSMIKTALATSLHSQVLMTSPCKALNKCLIRCLKETIKNQTEETTINPHWFLNGKIRTVYPLRTAGLMASHQIFPTMENLANVRRKTKN